jgi:hypothetical protein
MTLKQITYSILTFSAFSVVQNQLQYLVCLSINLWPYILLEMAQETIYYCVNFKHYKSE